MAFCDICGKKLKEEEARREIKGKQVCHDCMYDGLELLQNKFSDLQREGRDRRESKRKMASDEKKKVEQDQEE